MRTSKGTEQAKRPKLGSRLRYALTIVMTIIAACAVNAALDFAIVPYASRAQYAWRDYRETEGVDTIIVGSSLAGHAFDPAVLDEELGTVSINLATPQQWLEESRLAIAKVLADGKAKTVVLGIDYSRLQEGAVPSPTSPFLVEMNAGDPLNTLRGAAWMLSLPHFASSPSSLNWPFRWIKSHVKFNMPALVGNMRHKLANDLTEDRAVNTLGGWKHVGQGYGNMGWSMKEGGVGLAMFDEVYGSGDFVAEELAVLDRICDDCEAYGADFVVVGMPLPAFDIYSFGDRYFELGSQLSAHLEQRGVSYYDFNLARPELFEGKHELFYDFQHLNFEGGEVFTRAFARFMRARSEGTDQELFMEPEEWWATHQGIDLVTVDMETGERGPLFRARALAGKGFVPEYRFELRTSEEGEFELVQDWSEDSECYVELPSGTHVEVRVSVREQGASDGEVRTAVFTADYQGGKAK